MQQYFLQDFICLLTSVCESVQSIQSLQGTPWVAKDQNYIQADFEDWQDCANAPADQSLLWPQWPITAHAVLKGMLCPTSFVETVTFHALRKHAYSNI